MNRIVKHEKEVDFNAHLQYNTKLASFLNIATSIGKFVLLGRAILAKNGRQYSYCDEIAMAAAIDLHRVARKLMHLRVNVELSGTYTSNLCKADVWASLHCPDPETVTSNAIHSACAY
ncbi:hypothetical protein ANCDUO_22462 [Ancylostoma duodenale]|uniref:Uncharacterized protein n=1 Tax=Ancylostoma duodenale TaxID=51022 RepID=A0A0C2BU71_9BILA|nr:hypothetical protein ANCDUO_22462 [Ancylostoma duodenale]